MDVSLVVHPESVVLVALDGDGLVAVRQSRPGAPVATLELPSGKLEPGETPEEAAARELAEECGLGAREYRRLGAFWVVPAYSTERCHAFEASGLFPVPRAAPDADEDIEVERVPLAGARDRLSDAASLAALALWEGERRRVPARTLPPGNA